MKPIVVLIAVMMVVSSLTYAAIINVPGDYVTVQAALNVATQGDSVLVEPGFYRGSIIWPAVNGISLLSVGDSSNTVLSGNYARCVINVEGNGSIDSTTSIGGFKIINGGGGGYLGGGVRLNGASPVIYDCMITGNTANIAGGGIECQNSNAIIRNCSISQNVTHAEGGGIYGLNSSPTIENCLIYGNRLGGIRFDHGSPIIRNCMIEANLGWWGWSTGLFFVESNPTVDNCSIVNNEHGGGIFCASSDAVITGSLIEGNSSISNGSGIYCVESNPIIQHCTITRNSTIHGVGGIYPGNHSTPLISHCNIYENGMGVYNNDPTLIVECPNNWWGHATGPYNPVYNPTGLGDSTNESVNPIPFLTEPDSVAPPAEVPKPNVQEPASFALFQNYPNPFNATTNITFSLPVICMVSLKVYDILGREVATVVDNKQMSFGYHSVAFGNSNLSSGVYFYQLTADRNTSVGKMVLLK